MLYAMTAPAAQDRAFFGHPRGLSTLFFTEMWERFSYYGMRAFLILYMVTPAAHGGLGFSDPDAASIYGTYTGSVWGAAILGGIVADRFLGQYRSVLIGGIIIALGHFTLAFKALPFFYSGLALIVVGTGLLKPNVSTVVGSLYPPGDPRRDAGFSIFYMGINLGAFLGPLVAGYLAQRVDWHVGFASAGIGMAFGVTQYVLGRKHLTPAVERLAQQGPGKTPAAVEAPAVASSTAGFDQPRVETDRRDRDPLHLRYPVLGWLRASGIDADALRRPVHAPRALRFLFSVLLVPDRAADLRHPLRAALRVVVDPSRAT